MDLFHEETINITVSKEDAVIIAKCLKIAKARKKLEANQELRKGFTQLSAGKTEMVNKINQLEHYLHYLLK